MILQMWLCTRLLQVVTKQINPGGWQSTSAPKMQRQFLQRDCFIDLTLFGKQAFLPGRELGLSRSGEKSQKPCAIMCDLKQCQRQNLLVCHHNFTPRNRDTESKYLQHTVGLNIMLSQMDVAPWCYKWMRLDEWWVNYRAPYVLFNSNGSTHKCSFRLAKVARKANQDCEKQYIIVY